MLNVYTNTFCRPDYVQLLADAIAATAREEFRLVVIVQPGGLRRDWRGVHEIVDGTTTGYAGWRDAIPLMAESSKSVIVHDDCVPILPWDSSSFPAIHCRRPGASTLHFYGNGYASPMPVLSAVRVTDEKHCAPQWSRRLCDAAKTAYAESMLQGAFIHLDKGTIGHPSCGANQHKPALVEAICEELGIEKPRQLTPEELAAHPGKNIPSPRPAGLGDMVASALSAVGITKERVSSVVGRDCGCAKRQRSLNEFGKKFGIG